MKSIMEIVDGVRKLEKVPCNIRVIFYTEKIGGVEVNKVAIHTFGHNEEVDKAKDFEYCKHCVTMFEEQYNEILKPLFENIGKLNKQITVIQESL